MNNRQKQLRKLRCKRKKNRRRGIVGPAQTPPLKPQERPDFASRIGRANRQLERMLQGADPTFRIDSRWYDTQRTL